MKPTIGILSPGDMGHTVGRRLRENGLRVVAHLADRSARTQRLAMQAEIEEVASYELLVQEADMMLCILVPAQAQAAAHKVATALRKTDATLLYADCNAIAPQTTRHIGTLFAGTAARFVDASIIGPPPHQDGTTRFYASGTHASQLAQLNEFGLHVPVLSDRIGDASAIKMCYAGLTKGLTALCMELLLAAEALGVRQALLDEYRTSQMAMVQRMERGLPGMPPKARRWIGEMEEIAATLAAVGLTPKFHEGAADIYRFIAASSLADRTPEDPNAPTLEEIVQMLAGSLPTT